MAAALLIGPAMPGANGSPTDLHAAERPEFVPQPSLNPLSQVTFQSLEPTTSDEEESGVIGPETPILRISVPDDGTADAVSSPGCVLFGEEAPTGCLRTVTLDAYDGQVWATTGIYRRSGVQLRSPVPSFRAREEPQSMVIEPTKAFGGQWLPLPDRVISLDAGTPVMADAATGSVVVPPGESVPASYEVEWQPLESSRDVLLEVGAGVEAPCTSVACGPGSASRAFSDAGRSTLTEVGSELLRSGRSPAFAADVANGLRELSLAMKQLSPAADPIEGGHQVRSLSEFLPESESPTRRARLPLSRRPVRPSRSALSLSLRYSRTQPVFGRGSPLDTGSRPSNRGARSCDKATPMHGSRWISGPASAGPHSMFRRAAAALSSTPSTTPCGVRRIRKPMAVGRRSPQTSR